MRFPPGAFSTTICDAWVVVAVRRAADLFFLTVGGVIIAPNIEFVLSHFFFPCLSVNKEGLRKYTNLHAKSTVLFKQFVPDFLHTNYLKRTQNVRKTHAKRTQNARKTHAKRTQNSRKKHAKRTQKVPYFLVKTYHKVLVKTYGTF